tara:strand:+ start:23347 stop:23601 length:255 start_codon:yes stop_codon:yes gene_type:complete
MAEILEEFPADLEEMRGRRARYKEEWFDGQVRLLYMETDLNEYKSVNSARNALIHQSRTRELDYKIVQNRGNLYFQVVKKNVTP